MRPEFPSNSNEDIPTGFDEAQYLQGRDVFRVRQGDRWGVYDNEGNKNKLIVPCEYDDIDGYINGLDQFVVKKGGKKGLFHRYLGEVVPCEYEGVYELQNEIDGSSHTRYYMVQKEGKWGVFDSRTRALVIPCQYADGFYSYGVGYMVQKDGKFGILSVGRIIGDPMKEEYIVPCEYEKIDSLGMRDVFKVKKDGLWGVFNTSAQPSELTVPCLYEDIIYLNRNLFSVEKDGKWGVFNGTAGTLTVPCHYDNIWMDNLAEFSSTVTDKKSQIIVEDGIAKGTMDPQTGEVVWERN